MAFKSRIGKFTKLGRSSRSPLMLAAFAVLFAGIGAYLIHNSSAATPGTLKVTVTEVDSSGLWHGVNIGGATVTTSSGNTSYKCTEFSSSQIDSGTTNSAGQAFFSCLTYSYVDASNTGKQYTVSVSKTGYTGYLASQPIRIREGVETIVGLSMVKNVAPPADSDGDGIVNSSDDCPTSAGVAANNGCPSGSLVPNSLIVSTGATSVAANTTFNMTWSGNSYLSNCSVGPKPGAINTSGTFTVGGGISGTTTFTLTCSQSQVSGNSAANSPLTRTVNVSGAPVACEGGSMTGNTCNCPTGQTVVNGKCVPSSTGGSGGGGSGGGGSSGGGGTTVVVSTSSGGRVVARTPAAPVNSSDQTKPTVPENFKAEQFGAGEVDLSWDASTDNVGVAGYTLERSSDQRDWTMLDDAITDTNYSDTTADYNVTYSYRLSAKDASGNFSDYAVVDITTNDFSANVKADEESTITSDDGIVEVTFPAGALSEDAFCEINKDSVSKNPKGYKLAAGGYTIDCRNKAGDTIDSIDKELKVVMHLKAYTKKYSKFTAYAVGDSLSAIPSTFNSKTGDLSFNLSELQTFAAFGSKKGSSWWIWLLLVLLIVGVAFLIRRLRGGGGSDDYYDTTDYVSMPPSAPVSPLDTGAGGYQHHPSLPELVAQGGQPQPQPQAGQFPGAAPQQPGPGQQPPYPPQQPPLPPQ